MIYNIYGLVSPIDGQIVYVGVTLREINERFREHIFSKSLNLVDYSIIEFDKIEHPLIDSIHIYYEERKKVVELERKYIRGRAITSLY